MKRLLLIGALATAIPFAVSAQTTPAPSTTTPTTPTVTLPDPGLVPGDFFYFLDRWGEDINSFFTFNPEGKARLALKHAEERAAEVHVVLGKKGVDAPEVKQAKQDFEEEMSLAASIVADQKAKGVDVSAFAEEIDNDFEISKDMLREAYRGYHSDLKDAEKNLREKLKEATKAGDTAEMQALQSELQSIVDEQGTVKNEEGDVDQGFDAEKQYLYGAMGDRQSAERHIANADRAYQMFVGEAQKGGFTPDANAVASYKQLIDSAKEALATGDFETAKENAKESKRVLDDARQSSETQNIEEDFWGGVNGGDEDSLYMMSMPDESEAGMQGEGKKQDMMGRPEQGGVRIRGIEDQYMQEVQGMPAPDMRDVRPDGQE